MRLLRVGKQGSERPAVAGDDGVVRLLDAESGDVDGVFWTDGRLERAREQVAQRRGTAVGELTDDGRVLLHESGRVGTPMIRPGKIIGIGMNYRDHATEVGSSAPSEPSLFMKAPYTVNGPYDEILIPPRSTKTDWETELGVVVATTARYLDSPDDAWSAIGGYVLVNDVSERAFQFEQGPTWDKGKNCETFAPLGPWIATADEIADPQSVPLRCWVNGTIRQDGTTADMVFPVHHLVWYVSQLMRLEPGDLICTGTPAGVAMGHDDVPFLRDGDTLELFGEGLGRQVSALRQA